MSEQGGLLLGNVFYDHDLNNYHGIVQKAIPGDSAKGSAVYLQMGHDTWSEMMHKIDKIQEEEKELNLRVIGWYHTHPNELNVFMSGTDMNTQQKFFNEDWHFAIVLNPHRQIWKVFSGKDASVCRGYFLSESPLVTERDNSSDEKVTNRPPLPTIVKDQTRRERMAFIARLLRLRLFRIFSFIIVVLLGVLFYLFNKNDYNAQTVTKVITSSDSVRMKPRNEPGSSKISLKQGTIIYSANFKSVFEGPISNSIEVSVSTFNDSSKNVETYLYVHHSASVVTGDSTLKIFENLRTADSAFKNTLVGKVADTLSISKESYITKGDWFKIKFSGVIKQ
jgi:proteasome lid subunit RPN8/RPN11